MKLATTDCQEPDCRLQTRYRRLTIAIALPTFLLVAILAGVEYSIQREHTLQNLRERNFAVAESLEQLAVQASARILQLKAWSESFHNLAPPNDNKRYFQESPATGLTGMAFVPQSLYTLNALPAALRDNSGQLLWAGDDDSLATGALSRVEDFFLLCRLDRLNLPEIATSYWLASGKHQAFAAIYPWRAAETLTGAPASDAQALSVLFASEFYRLGQAAANPERRHFWTAPRLQNGTPTVTHAAPIYASGEFAGAVAVDLPLTSLQARLRQWSSPIGRLLVVHANGSVLADSAGLPAEALLKLEDLGLLEIDQQKIAEIAASTGRCRHCAIPTFAYSLDQTPWYLVLAVDNAELRRSLWPQLLPYGLILLGLAGTLWLSMFALRREFIAPALRMANYLQKLVREGNAAEPDMPPLWHPWVEAISATFASHRRAQQQLLAGESFKSAIVENSMLAVISMDARGLVTEFNKASEQVFGFSAQQVLGHDLAERIIPLRYRQAHRDGLQRHLQTRQSKVIGAHLELSALHADGHEFPIELTIFETPLGDESFYTAFVADLTQRKQAEQEADRQREALRQSEKLSAMGALLAGVAHELNNPLAILMGRAALLENKASDPKVREDAERIRIAADRCGRIVKTFLAMARQKPAERKPAKLNDAVNGAVELLGYGLRSAGIELDLALDNHLPALDMDSDQIGQVLVNLIVNAQQALSTQLPPRKLRIETGEYNGYQYLRVTDNGPGVPEDLRERIFDPFFTTKSEGTGTGIGLSVCRAIVREHGGELALEDKSLGASFRVSLPATAPTDGENQAASPAVGSESQFAHEGNVLVVDDETEVATVLAEILRSAGYQVHVAASGNQALDWLQHHPCDMLFSDVRMPDMDGITLWRTLRIRHPQLVKHMALVTGDTLSAGIAPLLAETGLPCLEKPFLPDEVLMLAATIEP